MKGVVEPKMDLSSGSKQRSNLKYSGDNPQEANAAAAAAIAAEKAAAEAAR